jgi:hypothetical protein
MFPLTLREYIVIGFHLHLHITIICHLRISMFNKTDDNIRSLTVTDILYQHL